MPDRASNTFQYNVVDKMIIDTSRQVNFGVYKGTRLTGYGRCDYGVFKGKNIEIYSDKRDKTKLFYVSDQFRNWIKSKLEYFDKGIKKVIRSENKK